MRRSMAILLLSLAVAGTAVAGFSFAAAYGPDAGHDMTTLSVHIYEWGFTLSSESAPVGTVVFNVVNDGDFEHDFSIDSNDTPLLKQGETATVTVNFTEPGRYEYSSTHDDIDRDMYGVFTVTGTAVSTTTTARTATSTTTTPPPPSTLPLRRVADVPLTGGSSRFDYQSLDAGRNRLYIAHLGAGSIVVFDVRRRRVVTTIGDVPGVHGVLAVPALGRLYAAATDTRQLATIRERDDAIVARTPAGVYPDGIAFDSAGAKSSSPTSPAAWKPSSLPLAGGSSPRSRSAERPETSNTTPCPDTSSPTCRRETSWSQSTRGAGASSPATRFPAVSTTTASLSTPGDGSRSSHATETQRSSSSTSGAHA